jgi:hypothetical protein
MSYDRWVCENWTKKTMHRIDERGDDIPEPARIDWANFPDEDLKKYSPKKWAEKHGLTVGKVYTYNEVKGQECTWLQPGDEVTLKHTLPNSAVYVEVETLDLSCSGKVHVVCLMLGGL